MPNARRKAPPKRTRPLFKRDARVSWTETEAVLVTGTVRDIHRLGGHGVHYEVAVDGEPGAGREMREAEIRALLPEHDPAVKAAPMRELLGRIRDVGPNEFPPSVRELREAWMKAGCPGL